MGAQCTTGDRLAMQMESLDYTTNNLEEMIAEIKEYMSLTDYCTKNMLANNQNQRAIINDFQIDQYIGKGTLGKIYSITYAPNGTLLLKEDATYAMKIIKKSKLFQKSNALLSLQPFHHPFITQVRFAFQNMANIYIMSEYMTRGELFYHVRKGKGKLEQEHARFYGGQILLALEFIHTKKNLAYRYLKPENILLDDDGNIKLTDFGLLKFLNKRPKTEGNILMTPQYVAPEIHSKKEQTAVSDWYSFGAILYDMLIGKAPFFSKNQLNSKNQISIPSRLSSEAKSLLEGLLKFKPEHRLGSKGSQQIRSHPFFKGLDFQKLFNRQIQPPIKEYIVEQIFEDYDDKSSMYEKSSLKSGKMGAKSIKSQMNKEWDKIDGKKNRNISPETANTSQHRKTTENTIEI